MCLILIAVLTGCAGRSGDTTDYRHKVANTAQAVHSSLSAAGLQLEIARDGKTFATSLRVALQQTYADATSTSEGFDAVAPPTAAARSLRERVDRALAAATTLLARLRDLVAAGETGRLASYLPKVQQRVAALRPFEELA